MRAGNTHRTPVETHLQWYGICRHYYTCDMAEGNIEHLGPHGICSTCGKLSVLVCPKCQLAFICKKCTQVLVKDLQKSPQYNGRSGHVLTYGHETKDQRWEIQLDPSCQIRVRLENLVLKHALVVSLHVKTSMPCEPYGFKRIALPESLFTTIDPVPDQFAKYACIHFMGYGRWDAQESTVHGLSTYGVRVCRALLVCDSMTSPTRFVLIHASTKTIWAHRVVQEVQWVAEGGRNPMILMLKGSEYVSMGRHPLSNDDVFESELRWELPDSHCPQIRAALDAAGLHAVPLLLEHRPLPSGAVTFGRCGLIIPKVSYPIRHGILGEEPSPQQIAARHSAYVEWENRLNPAIERYKAYRNKPFREHPLEYKLARKGDLDFQFDRTVRLPPSLPDLLKIWHRLKDRPLITLPFSLCEYKL